VVTTSGKGLTTAQASDLVQAHKAKLAAGMGASSSESALPMPEVANAGDKTAGSPKRIDTVQGLDEHLKSLEDAMNSVGDDAQLANIDLQNCLQRQQQTLQMMSNISKTLHDVAMSIIRNMNS